MTFPKFNDARGETASMQLIPPFQFTGVTMRVFPLRANRYLLQRFIDGQLNIIPPEAGTFRVFLPYIYLIVINYGKMAVTAANLGWISQNEVAFSVPMIWQRKVGGEIVQDFAYVSPFIYVDNPLSMTTGREVYGWPKVMSGFDPQLSAWMSNPMYRTQQAAMSVDVIREAYAGGRSVRSTLLEIDSAPTPSMVQVPLDVRNPMLPWNSTRKAVYSTSALMGDSVDILRATAEMFIRPGDREALLDQVRRTLGNPLSLAVLNTVNLKQFRDAAEPEKFAYQSVTNTPMTIRSFRRGGMLGDLRALAGDVTGGYMIRLHNYDTQPIVGMLGLEVASTSNIEGANVSNLAPVFPFWLEVDLDYPLATTLAWRQKDSPGWFHGDQLTTTKSDDVLYNTQRGAASQEIAGPFEMPNATYRILPLQADQTKLQAFLDAYLNVTLADAGSRFEAWGSYVYMIVMNDHDTISLSNNIGDLATREAGLMIPVKWYDAQGLVSTALVPAYAYSNSAPAAISNRGVNGIPSMAAQLSSPASTWLERRGPSPEADDKLLTLRGDVLPVLNLGQQAKTRTIIQCDTREPVGHDDDEGWRRLAGSWVPPLKHELERKQAIDPNRLRELKALALELLANGAPFRVLTLKQFRSAFDPSYACYQALVAIPTRIEQLYEIEEIESDIHVRIHEYPSQAIVETLGLVVKAWERGSGSRIAVIEPSRPFWFRAQLRQELGENIHVWTMTSTTAHWTPAPEQTTLIREGTKMGPMLVDAIEDGTPQHLREHTHHWLPLVGGGLHVGLSPAETAAAVEAGEPQVVIESILSNEWEAHHDPRWIRGRDEIVDRLHKVAAGAFPSEVTCKLAEELVRICGELNDPVHQARTFRIHRSRPVDRDLEQYRELADRLAKVQAAEEELRSLEMIDKDGDGKPDQPSKKSKTKAKALERLETANEQLLAHLLELRHHAEQQVGAVAPGAGDATADLDVLTIFHEAFSGFGGALGTNLTDMDDDTREQIVGDLKAGMEALRDHIVKKLSKSWQKPDHCVRRQTILRGANQYFPSSLSFDDYWYVGIPAAGRPRLTHDAPIVVPAPLVAMASRLVGVMPNNELCVHEPGAQPFWAAMPGSGAVTDIAFLPDGRLLGIGMDHYIWVRANLHAPWQQVPNSAAILGITVFPDGRIIGIGMQGDLYTRDHLDAPWVHVPGSGNCRGVCVGANGMIVVAGSGADLCVRDTITSPWRLVDASLPITKVVALPEGQLVAIGSGQELFVRASLEAPWEPLPGSGAVIGIAVVPDSP